MGSTQLIFQVCPLVDTETGKQKATGPCWASPTLIFRGSMSDVVTVPSRAWANLVWQSPQEGEPDQASGFLQTFQLTGGAATYLHKEGGHRCQVRAASRPSTIRLVGVNTLAPNFGSFPPVAEKREVGRPQCQAPGPGTHSPG